MADTFDAASYCGKYVALRDKIAEIKDAHKAQLAPYNEALETLGNLLLKHLQDNNTDSMATKGGTFYESDKTSAPLSDPALFREHVVASQDWDLADWKANPTAVQEYLKTHQELPPGVNITTYKTIGVRRPSKSKQAKQADAANSSE
jgi:hypothetical protein